MRSITITRTVLALLALLVPASLTSQAETVWSDISISTLVRRLDHPSFDTRNRAQGKLTRLARRGWRASPTLLSEVSLEVRSRLQSALHAASTKRPKRATSRKTSPRAFD